MTPSATHLTIRGKDWINEDGKLNFITPEDFIAAALRIRYEVSQMPGALNPLPSLSSYSLRQIHTAGCAKGQKGQNSARKPKQSKISEITSKVEALGDQVIQERIALRTRLADKAWNNGLYFKVYINHDSLFKILSEGQDLAKGCLWTWVRINRPRYLGWLGYLFDVDFSGDNFRQFIERMPTDFFAFRYSKSHQVKRKLHDLVGLRNLVCHFNGLQDVRHMDVYLENVHELAVLFYDEPRAVLARALRDKLRTEAQRTLQEIEALTILTHLPEARHAWLLHHRNTVLDAVNELDRGYHQHPILVTAARVWVAHHAGWEYGTLIPLPEVEENTGMKGRSSDEPNMLNAAVGERRTKLLDKEDKPDEDFISVDDCMLMLEEGEILE